MTEALVRRLKAALADRYLIERELGQGGMAMVYLARDLKHGRQVAVKVLKPELAAVIGAERFLQEIHVTAHLQHPHVLALFDSGEADSFLFYVMPYLEGESLRDRLNREKQLPVEDAVRIATEVAAALSHAHSRGVIHRDVKPENVLLMSGAAVVADFGIARAVTAAGGGRLTETGLSLGTPQYMSPEQATADRELDGRSDIYSLACVLYEMLAGEPPHTGPTTQSVIAKILTDEPRSVRVNRPTVPPHIESAVHRALAKLPADRFGTAQQFAAALTQAGGTVTAVAGGRSVVVPIPRPVASAAAWIRRNRLASTLAVGLGIVTSVAIWGVLRSPPPPPPPPVAQFTIRLPSSAPLASGQTGTTIAISPDGSRLVYVAATAADVQLYSRRLNQLDAVPVPGTVGALQPFFSPDGQWLAFQRGRRLEKVAMAGGPVLPVCTLPDDMLGGSWSSLDTIVFATGADLMAVSANGGVPSRLTTADTSHGEVLMWPEVLPNGRAVLLTSRTGVGDRLAVFTFRDRTLQRLDQPGSNPHYVNSGHVVLASLTGALVAVPFHSTRFGILGAAVPVAEGVDVGPLGPGKLGISRDGVLAYAWSRSQEGRLVLVDRRGATRDLVPDAQPLAYGDPRFSPDGGRVALRVPTGTGFDVWVFDMAQGTRTRVTFDSTGNRPVWTPDGRRIVYSRNNKRADLYLVPVDGSGPAEAVLIAPDEQYAGDFTPDGQVLLFRQGASDPRSLWYTRMDSVPAARQFLAGEFSFLAPSLSPDGRWVAYASNESGRWEVYVRPFPRSGGRWQVSLNGGTEPRWSPTGREIFYRSADKMMAAAVQTVPGFAVLRRTPLFQGSYASSVHYQQYDVTRDGQSFVMVKLDREPQDMVVVLNWFAHLGTDGGGIARAESER